MTLKEIAELTGSSSAAVSRVLNASGYVRADKREIIAKALLENGYVLREQRRRLDRTIAEKTVHIIADSLHISAAYVEYIDGIRDCLKAQGINTYIYLTDGDTENEVRQLEICAEMGILGVLMIGAVESPRLVKRLRSAPFPVIMLNRYLKSFALDSVLLDNYQVGYMATQLLIDKGHRHIAHLAGPKESSASEDRLRGYIDAMRDAKLACGEDTIAYGEYSYNKGYSYAREFCCEKFTAVFSSSDVMALGFIDGIYDRGLSCPEHVSVICTEDTKTLVSGKVRMTTIGYDNYVIGKTAGELLLERIANPETRKRTISYMPVIVERDSVRKLEAFANGAERQIKK